MYIYFVLWLLLWLEQLYNKVKALQYTNYVLCKSSDRYIDQHHPPIVRYTFFKKDFLQQAFEIAGYTVPYYLLSLHKAFRDKVWLSVAEVLLLLIYGFAMPLVRSLAAYGLQYCGHVSSLTVDLLLELCRIWKAQETFPDQDLSLCLPAWQVIWTRLWTYIK